MREIRVPLNWTAIDWDPDETWRKSTLPKLKSLGVRETDIAKSVYVIRLNGDFAILYPKGESPTVYVGEGNFSSRINSHRSWVSEIRDLAGKFSFQVCVGTPRVKNCPDAYLDCEAVLLQRFGELFSTAPLWNKQFQNRKHPHHIYSQRQIDYALCKRSGAKYKWAIKPMRSSIFGRSYEKTHF